MAVREVKSLVWLSELLLDSICIGSLNVSKDQYILTDDKKKIVEQTSLIRNKWFIWISYWVMIGCTILLSYEDELSGTLPATMVQEKQMNQRI